MKQYDNIIKNGTIPQLWEEASMDHSIPRNRTTIEGIIKPVPKKKCFLEGCFRIYWVSSALTGEDLLQVVWRTPDPDMAFVAYIGEDKDSFSRLWNIEVYFFSEDGHVSAGQSYPKYSTGFIKQPVGSLFEELKHAKENLR